MQNRHFLNEKKNLVRFRDAMKKNPEKSKMKSVSVPYRDISVDVLGSKLDKQTFPNICSDLINLKMFENMVHTRLWLGNRQRVNLMWWSDDPNFLVYLCSDEDFER